MKKGAKKDAEKFVGKGKRQYLCNRKSETDRWSKLERDAGGRRTGADAGFWKRNLKKKFAKNLAVKNKGSTFVTAFRKGNGAENIEMMR